MRPWGAPQSGPEAKSSGREDRIKLKRRPESGHSDKDRPQRGP